MNRLHRAWNVLQGKVHTFPPEYLRRPDGYRNDFTQSELDILSTGRLGLTGSDEAAVSLIRAVDYVLVNNIPGDLVECGVYRGANLEIMIRSLQRHGSSRSVWAYDTFTGMPKPTAKDGMGPEGPASASWRKGWMEADLASVQARIKPLGHPTTYIQGLVEDTIPKNAPGAIALLRLDTDFYSSTKHELTHLYPLLSRRGILIIDDYGAFDGCKTAVDEYFGTSRYLHRIDPHVRLVIK